MGRTNGQLKQIVKNHLIREARIKIRPAPIFTCSFALKLL